MRNLGSNREPEALLFTQQQSKSIAILCKILAFHAATCFSFSIQISSGVSTSLTPVLQRELSRIFRGARQQICWPGPSKKQNVRKHEDIRDFSLQVCLKPRLFC